MMNCNAPDVPYEQQAKPAPLRTRTGPRLSKAEKKVEKRRRQQAQGLALIALGESRRQVRQLLEGAERYAWRFCQSGHLMLPLDDGSTLLVYSPAQAVRETTDVTALSMHATGYVVNGRISRTLFEERTGGEIVLSQAYVAGKGRVGSPVRACLVKADQSLSGPGDHLDCAAGSINRLQASEGAVMIMRHEQADGFMARSYWPLDSDLVPDQLSLATAAQVGAITGAALATWSDQ